MPKCRCEFFGPAAEVPSPFVAVPLRPNLASMLKPLTAPESWKSGRRPWTEGQQEVVRGAITGGAPSPGNDSAPSLRGGRTFSEIIICYKRRLHLGSMHCVFDMFIFVKYLWQKTTGIPNAVVMSLRRFPVVHQMICQGALGSFLGNKPNASGGCYQRGWQS